MQAHGLRLEQAPPFSVPFRFFVTAPGFLLLAAAALLWRGPELAQSRFSPAAIAATHLYVLGFMSMVMIGALQQMLPVLAGAPIRWPVLSLLATAAIGLALVSSLAWGDSSPQPWALALHPAWGLLGWTGLLMTGLGFQVVPMLQSTPGYPVWMVRSFAPVALALLLALSAACWAAPSTANAVLSTLRFALAAVYAVFAAVTVALLRRRRRRLPDVAADFWSVGMVSLFAACTVWAFSFLAPGRLRSAFDLSIGILALIGFAGSVINGMLYKIVPFLGWFHAQAQAARGSPTPNIRTMLGQAEQRLQFRFHVLALALLLLASAWSPALLVPAALALAASAALLGRNLLAVVRRRAGASTH